MVIAVGWSRSLWAAPFHVQVILGRIGKLDKQEPASILSPWFLPSGSGLVFLPFPQAWIVACKCKPKKQISSLKKSECFITATENQTRSSFSTFSPHSVDYFICVITFFVFFSLKKVIGFGDSSDKSTCLTNIRTRV